MRIYTQAAFVFRHPILLDETVITRAKEIKDVPEWVEKDKTFIDGRSAGLIEVLTSREGELKAELKAADKKPTARGSKKNPPKPESDEPESDAEKDRPDADDEDITPPEE